MIVPYAVMAVSIFAISISVWKLVAGVFESFYLVVTLAFFWLLVLAMRMAWAIDGDSE